MKIITQEIVQGYKPDKEDSRDHIFGSGQTPDPVILPSGNWREVKLLDEVQKKYGFETFGCVIFTILNVVEKLGLKLFGIAWNKAERFTYIVSETNPADRGNSPRKVANSVRKKGVIAEIELPFTELINTIEKFNSPRPLTKDLLKKGQLFLENYVFGYDYLPKTGGVVSRETLREALLRSPVGIAVHAWSEQNGKYIRPQGKPDTHFTLLENVTDDELEAMDSYEPFQKTLSKDFPIYVAMRFYLRERTEEEKLEYLKKQLNLLKIFLIWLSSFIPYLKRYLLEEPKPEPTPEPKPEPEVDVSKSENEDNYEPPKFPIYKWGTKEETRHSVRVICDEEELSWNEKNLITAVIACESGFNVKAINVNINGTTDYGICQYNDYYYIGNGKPIASVYEALNNPEKCVRIMIKQYRHGLLKHWVCYKNGAYKKYL